VLACAVGVIALAGTAHSGVLRSADKLTDDEKIEILRNLTAEYGKAKTLLPRSKKPLEFDINGTWDKAKWQEAAQTLGPAARLGDEVKITHVGFDGDKLVLEINGGLKSGKHWYDHIQAGVGNNTQPVGNGDYAPSTGTNIEINFHHPLENLNSAEVKKLLAPLVDFDKHSVSQIYSETLPPEMQKAIAEKRVIEGMDRTEVLMAVGHPLRKYRETNKDGADVEDWIYGQAPGKITFVTFSGAKVIKVKEQYAGLGMQSTP